MRRLRSWTLQEPPIERPEYQDNSDVYDQPLPEVVPEEQDVHADHDRYQREHIKHDGCLSSHRFVLLGAAEWSKNGVYRRVHQASMITSWAIPVSMVSCRARLTIRSSCGWNGRAGSSPSTGPKASMSGFHRLAQLRPGPVVSAMVSPAGPGLARPGSMVAACTASRSWSCCFHCWR